MRNLQAHRVDSFPRLQIAAMLLKIERQAVLIGGSDNCSRRILNGHRSRTRRCPRPFHAKRMSGVRPPRDAQSTFQEGSRSNQIHA